MPAKKQVTREEILDGALSLFRERGMESINARELARRLNCSTQPIYLSFEGMDALKAALIDRMQAYYEYFLLREMAREDVPRYKAYGLGYIQFAVEESEMFRYLFMRAQEPQTEDSALTRSYIAAIDAIVAQTGLSEEEAVRFHGENWLFVHGIATMSATGYRRWSREEISEMMTDVYRGLLTRYQRKERLE